LKFIKKQKYIIEKLKSLSLDFNDLFILECFYYEEDREFFNMFTIPSLKDLNFSIRFQFLNKLEYLVEDPNNISKIIISNKGKKLLEELLSPSIQVSLTEVSTNHAILNQTEDEMFEEWWKLYPTTPSWISDDGQIKFLGSRNLKNLRKSEAKKRYLKLLNQGLKHEELLGSLKFEVKLKKIESINKNANQMDFFKGMESYFNSERYLLFIDSYKENPEFVKGEEAKVRGRKKNVVDI
jgi:hypothetical protein